MQIGILECTGIMGQNLVHSYIQSTTVLCDMTKCQCPLVTVATPLSLDDLRRQLKCTELPSGRLYSALSIDEN